MFLWPSWCSVSGFHLSIAPAFSYGNILLRIVDRFNLFSLFFPYKNIIVVVVTVYIHSVIFMIPSLFFFFFSPSVRLSGQPTIYISRDNAQDNKTLDWP